jgi:Fic family protein
MRGTLEKRTWSADFSRYGGRRRRGSFGYEAFIPQQIADLELAIPGDVAEVVTEAQREIARLNQSPPALASLEALARQLLRTESLASSRIEGLTISHRRLAKAAVDRESTSDFNARTVIGNILAMERAIELGTEVAKLGTTDIRAIHERLFKGTRDDAIAGKIRDRQNWIGGDSDTPRKAEFIPPPPEHVESLLADLCEFMGRDDLPAVIQAAIAHAQFETIHPFADGNGRVGRCLIHLVFRRRELAPRYVPPVSLVLASDVRGYEQGLTDYRFGELADWCAVFAQASRTAALEAERFAAEIGQLQEEWLARAGNPRQNSAARKLIAALPAQPVIDVAAARLLADVSDVAAGRALRRLESAGVIELETKGRRRGRSWEARELFDLINGFERELIG